MKNLNVNCTITQGPQGPKGDKGDPGNAAVPIKIYMTGGTASHEVPLNSDGTECVLNAVYLNGIRQRAGIDYSVSVSEGIAQLTFAAGLEDADLVELEYQKIL